MTSPLDIHQENVRSEWIDYNGHMNVAYYVLAFDHATDGLLDYLDIGESYIRETNNSYFILENHVNYLQEVTAGEPLTFTLQMLDHDDKRLHYFTRMYHGEKGFLAATYEALGMHIDMDQRRSAPMPGATFERLAALKAEHSALPWPEQAGKVMGIRRK